MMEIGSSGARDIGKQVSPRRHGENQEIQIMISTSDLTPSNSPLCSFVSSVVNGFLVLTVFVLAIFVFTIVGNFGIAGNSSRIGVGA